MAHQNEEAKKLAVGFTKALLAKYADLGLSWTELCAVLNVSWEFWRHDPNPERFVETVGPLFAGFVVPREPMLKIGRYTAKQLKK